MAGTHWNHLANLWSGARSRLWPNLLDQIRGQRCPCVGGCQGQSHVLSSDEVLVEQALHLWSPAVWERRTARDGQCRRIAENAVRAEVCPRIPERS